ncbi:3-hydroxy-9,10-secoandrosta-1,3,5(10)-triene-9,17-dione monooxygenase reductase component [Streptomyces sp. DvalAA-14]|uniref:flavin reductase family protein n=1 Tax=unclassified Streptomyces TaxID=2593676 RepID=UPI00081B6699|nr:MULTISPECIES: flavin reductase family protein [unclassified Streptomyces]MYS20719.1 flavin reductase [Streptomyces sp. SID4948]SCD75396.1 3-hydroxy-9,10-secoandrosta-1,3,5(10)-triene-9,17-dione monooxygenase reductase component [Streptomyces sp. DvalAA-14]
MAVDANRFKELFGSFPTPVWIITAVDEDGEPRGFTCNALSAVSADPPLLLFCVDKRSQTLPALVRSGGFVVHVLAEGAHEASEVFAGKSEGKFTGRRWLPSAVAGGAPVLPDLALGYAECALVQRVEAGDHWICVGRVDGSAVFPRDPLLYHRRSYSVWRPAGALTGTSG